MNDQQLHPGPHPATVDPDQLLKDCDVKHGRGSGPGGQHRNKVQTAVTLTHRPTGVQGAASERRQQRQNHDVALFRLRVQLAIEIRCQPGDSPSERWQQRCRGGRIEVNESHADFPAMLAEAMDNLAANDWDFRATSEKLACSSSQLGKLLKKEPAAFEWVNRKLESLGRPKRR